MRRQRGFTVVEMLISVGVLGTVATLAAAVARATTGTNELAGAYAEDVRGLRRALRLIEEDVRGARGVGRPGRSSTLHLLTPSRPVVYRLDAGALERRTAGRAEVVARGLQSLTATVEEDRVRVVLELAPRARPDRPGPSVVTTVRLRSGGRGR